MFSSVDKRIARPSAPAQKHAMTLNLIKLCVGATCAEDLAAWQSSQRGFKSPSGGECYAHTTFQTPKRQTELLAGGSLYWVIKGVILVRQPLVGFGDGTKEDGSICCLLLLDPALIPVRPTARRPFQGWRYLTSTDAPADLKRGIKDDIAVMPANMRKKLADLGLI